MGTLIGIVLAFGFGGTKEEEESKRSGKYDDK